MCLHLRWLYPRPLLGEALPPLPRECESYNSNQIEASSPPRLHPAQPSLASLSSFTRWPEQNVQTGRAAEATNRDLFARGYGSLNPQIKLSARQVPCECRSLRLSQLLGAAGNFWHPSACRHIPPISASIFMWPSLCSNFPLL